MQEALIGALRAIRTHDPAVSRLSNWMTMTIKASCLDYCRQRMRILRISRALDPVISALRAADLCPFACLCDDVLLESLAGQLGISPQKLCSLLAEYDRSQHLDSTDRRESAAGNLPAATDPIDADEWIDLCAAWPALSSQRRRVILERSAGWTFLEIGQRMGFTESNAFYLHRNGVKQLRAQIAAASEGH
jgi:RNA polymerase sigma factor (sigma-70 family)